jgi:ribosomal protein L1
MAKLTKRKKIAQEKVEANKDYEFNEAVALLKELATAKFAESIDVAINLGIDARKSDQNVRGATVLPNGTGKDVRVAVFTQGANVEAAKASMLQLILVLMHVNLTKTFVVQLYYLTVLVKMYALQYLLKVQTLKRLKQPVLTSLVWKTLLT